MENKMIDLFEADCLEVIIDYTGTKVWVNGPDGCLLRVYNIKNLVIDDRRSFFKEE